MEHAKQANMFTKCWFLRPNEEVVSCVVVIAPALTQGRGLEVRRQDADFPRDEFVADLLEKLVGCQHAFSQGPRLILSCVRHTSLD